MQVVWTELKLNLIGAWNQSGVSRVLQEKSFQYRCRYCRSLTSLVQLLIHLHRNFVTDLHFRLDCQTFRLNHSPDEKRCEACVFLNLVFILRFVGTQGTTISPYFRHDVAHRNVLNLLLLVYFPEGRKVVNQL